MTRLVAMTAVLLMAAACSDDGTTPTTPSPNTGPIVFTASLGAANEVPPVTNAEANARGLATITFNVPRNAGGGVTGAGTVDFVAQLTNFPPGTPATLARLYIGPAGVVGTVVINTGLSAISPIVMDATGSATLNFTGVPVSQADATSIVANPSAYYFNVHTTLNATGAVRGQLVRQ